MSKTISEYANLIDHTLLKPDASTEDFAKLCHEAEVYGFKMVAINSDPVALCADFLKESEVSVGAAISFPLGQTTIETKVFETEHAIANGADEIDYVINIRQLKMGNIAYIEEEMRAIVTVCKISKVLCKVILETCYLNKSEIIACCEIAKKVGPDFVKTSTGFGTAGATVEHVALMKRSVGDAVGVKASGGIRDADTFLKMVEAGATRIGTTASITIIEQLKKIKTAL